LNILEEVFAEGNEKVVIFSQWERMTRIVAGELDARGIQYQHLYGGVPSTERGKLFENFNNNPDCKVFLSTDAGGVGLNLQAASLLINLDIPWNPAVLEQRIARIYRLGQKRNVSIINMVSTNTIEHKMLGVLSFKKGLSEGILDQGDNTIFMEDSKFKVLMNTVEEMIVSDQPTQSSARDEEDDEIQSDLLPDNQNTLPEETIQQQFDFEPVLPGDDDIKSNAPTFEKNYPQAETPVDLVQIGKLAQTLSDPEATQKLVSSIVQKDEAGKSYLKIPVDNEKMVENVLTLFSGLLGQLKK
jgi:superfamily II DNA/RNA helicase